MIVGVDGLVVGTIICNLAVMVKSVVKSKF